MRRIRPFLLVLVGSTFVYSAGVAIGPWLLVVPGLVLGGAAGGVVASSDGVIHGCVKQDDGHLRIVGGPQGCKKHEQSLS